MAGESALWNYLRNGMRGRWHAQRHEDKLALGIPDVSYGKWGIQGWIELKSVDAWPAYADSSVDVGLSREQSIWIWSRGDHGGRCFVLLRVGSREHLLFPWSVARELLLPQTRAQLIDLAWCHWPQGINWTEFQEKIIG